MNTTIRIQGHGTKARFCSPIQDSVVDTLTNGDYQLDISPADLVVSASADIPLQTLQTELAREGLCIPYQEPVLGLSGTLGGAISTNLPHLLEGHFGSWRDWVLGLSFTLGDGTTIKCGSRVVKNVAGYDLHKLFVGARGVLGRISIIHLRVYSLKALRKAPPECRISATASRIWIERTPRSVFANRLLQLGSAVKLSDSHSSTIWALPEVDDFLSVDHAGWAIDSRLTGCKFVGCQTSPPALRLKLKSIFDKDRAFASDQRVIG